MYSSLSQYSSTQKFSAGIWLMRSWIPNISSPSTQGSPAEVSPQVVISPPLKLLRKPIPPFSKYVGCIILFLDTHEIGMPQYSESNISIPLSGTTVNLKPVPVFTSIPFTPSFIPPLYSNTFVPAKSDILLKYFK